MVLAMEQQIDYDQLIDPPARHPSPLHDPAVIRSSPIWTLGEPQSADSRECDKPGERPKVDFLLGIEQIPHRRAGDDWPVLFKFRHDTDKHVRHRNSCRESLPALPDLYSESVA